MYVFRFGEESLHSCEVMLKDIEDSKRINNAIQSKVRVVFCIIHVCMYVCMYVFFYSHYRRQARDQILSTWTSQLYQKIIGQLFNRKH